MYAGTSILGSRTQLQIRHCAVGEFWLLLRATLRNELKCTPLYLCLIKLDNKSQVLVNTYFYLLSS